MHTTRQKSEEREIRLNHSRTGPSEGACTRRAYSNMAGLNRQPLSTLEEIFRLTGARLGVRIFVVLGREYEYFLYHACNLVDLKVKELHS